LTSLTPLKTFIENFVNISLFFILFLVSIREGKYLLEKEINLSIANWRENLSKSSFNEKLLTERLDLKVTLKQEIADERKEK
jgi:hypothetical protein